MGGGRLPRGILLEVGSPDSLAQRWLVTIVNLTGFRIIKEELKSFSTKV